MEHIYIPKFVDCSVLLEVSCGVGRGTVVDSRGRARQRGWSMRATNHFFGEAHHLGIHRIEPPDDRDRKVDFCIFAEMLNCLESWWLKCCQERLCSTPWMGSWEVQYIVTKVALPDQHLLTLCLARIGNQASDCAFRCLGRFYSS